MKSCKIDNLGRDYKGLQSDEKLRVTYHCKEGTHCTQCATYVVLMYI